MKLKMQLDVDSVEITPDGNDIKIALPISQGEAYKHGYGPKLLPFKTGLTCYISKTCGLDIIRKLKAAVLALEPSNRKDDDLDDR